MRMIALKLVIALAQVLEVVFTILFIPSEVFNGTDIIVGANVEWDNYGRYDSVFQNLRCMKSDYNLSIN